MSFYWQAIREGESKGKAEVAREERTQRVQKKSARKDAENAKKDLTQRRGECKRRAHAHARRTQKGSASRTFVTDAKK